MDNNGTELISNDFAGFKPVVGWLVCINGASKGMDFRVLPGYNYIGRHESNEICVVGDNSISREKHAFILYDLRDRKFYLSLQNGKNVIRVNDKPTTSMVPIQNHDVITLGKTTFLFVELCGRHFDWSLT